MKGNLVLYGALGANIGIAVAKFVAAAISGSSAMLTEGIHSLVDSGNQILMLYGARRSKQAPDAQHPFGYGRELYFWAFVVAILIFGLGAGMSVYEGWLHIRDPEPLRDPQLNYIVLAIGVLLEGGSWGYAVYEFNRKREGRSWWRALHRSKDPSSFVVLFEDSAALLGLVIAALGVWASHRFGDPRLDGAASIAIGGVLALVAALLARETKGLLIGESADDALVAGVWKALAGCEGVAAVNHVRTIHVGPQSVFAAISADFDDGMSAGDVEKLVGRIESGLKAQFPHLSSIYVRPESAATARRMQPPEA